MLTADENKVIELNEKIKQHLNIVDLLSSYGYGKEMGRAYSCPFHSDSSPSMHIDEEEQIFNCFSCGRHGTYVNMYREFEVAKLTEGQAKDFNYFVALEKLLRESDEVKELVDFDSIMFYRDGRAKFPIERMKMYKPNQIYFNYKILNSGKENVEDHLKRMYLLQING